MILYGNSVIMAQADACSQPKATVLVNAYIVDAVVGKTAVGSYVYEMIFFSAWIVVCM